MQFTRLKLSGFKSFVEPAELRIEPGLTGVVGPNGCGKSNLLEAIRWVMGEGSARSMRGGGMDDVIFAGTASRPSRDFAEVLLNAETDPSGPFGGELEVVRRIERGAGSAYRVNGRDVRAKDVALVFADAATGAHSPALVSQGRIAAVIAARPAERRAMLEEAAGIAGLHVRRKDAETKLRATETNLARLDDLIVTLEAQVGTLRRQARAAERYKSLSERVRVAEARLIFARWRDAAAAAEAARSAAKAAEDAVTAAQASARSAQDAQHTAAAAQSEARDALFDRRQDVAAVDQRVAALNAQAEAATQRLADIDRQIRRIEAEQGEADRLTRDAAEALAKLEGELAAAEAALAAQTAEAPSLKSAESAAEQAARAAELALAAMVAEQAGIEAEWRVAEAAVTAVRQRLARLDGEDARLAATARALDAEPDPAEAMATAEARRAEAAETLAAVGETRTRLTSERERLAIVREGASADLAAARADLVGLEREAAALARDKAAREAAAARTGKGPSALAATRAAPGYERALAAVLGRDSGAPLGAAPAGDGRFWTGAEAPTTRADALIHHVTQSPPELAARLALVRVAEADAGEQLAPGEWLVTREGHLRRWDGFVARGEGGAEAAVLAAENRLAELEAALPARRAAVETAEAASSAAQADLAQVQAELTASERALAAAADAERSALRALDQAEAARARIAVRRAEIDRAGADLAAQRSAAGTELAETEARRAALPDPAAGRAAVEAERQRNDRARAAYQSAMAAVAAHGQALAVGKERLGALRGDIRGWQARAGDAARRLAAMAGQAEDLAGERAMLAARPPALARELEDAKVIRTRCAADLAEAETTLARTEAEARAAETALFAANEALATAREARAGLAARAENEDLRRQEMAGIAGERFQCPPPLLPERIGFPGSDVGAAPEESAAHDRLIAERERLGPVNLVAATELTESEAQHVAIVTEQAELGEAVNRLRGSIGALNREGRERLRAAFEAVDGHFRRLFARLFGGGEAHLALVDSDDPLEAGLEIFAQPPGKRLQSLTLLSGGEQALTAVALIFALFLTNPAPICVLDEVDAPLDDANIERFCDLLDAMAAETTTRYLIVTHNAVTMSRMHRLFGVTMVERGVSRLVSVDLGGAESLLAGAAPA